MSISGLLSALAAPSPPTHPPKETKPEHRKETAPPWLAAAHGAGYGYVFRYARSIANAGIELRRCCGTVRPHAPGAVRRPAACPPRCGVPAWPGFMRRYPRNASARIRHLINKSTRMHARICMHRYVCTCTRTPHALCRMCPAPTSGQL